ncbi:hypothetical protein E2R66_03715 [Mucilaginibacter psychrotolerans]|uniref:Uncharacterized protein n=1 Tax=Mucilaginibacter psychrotolerans TaxID=1524096 RepID=A0A4Y8SPR9_9SPHI|nr:hypothetical protein E2R66_03715 [Mucilaginibacter psychrotolerans]
MAPQRGGYSQGGGFNRSPRTNSFGGFNRPNNTGSFNRGGFNRPGGNYGYRGGSYNRGGFSGYRGGGINRGVYAYRGGTYRDGVYRGGTWGRAYYGPRYFNRGYYNYRGYYNSYYFPRIGFSIGVLPFGYYPFYWGDYQYYYSDGLYYRQFDNQYTVVEPPVGAQVNALPSGAEAITINGEQYYEANGVYYRAVTRDDGTHVYEVAGKDGELNTAGGQDDQSYSAGDDAPLKIGDVVDQLPQDCRKIKVNGEKLYVAPDGTYFQEALDEDNNTVYKVVGLPSDDDAASGQ